ncbi:MAG: S41 family peptidase [Bacteroidota bacterium]
MKTTFTFLSLFFFFSFSSFSQDESLLLRYPALSPDGSQITFSWQGDIWTAASTGEAAVRRTVHESYESQPQWSPDGKHILFQGNRFGNSDLFAIDLQSGQPQRLTWHSASDANAAWGNNGNIYFTTRRTFAQVERESEIHTVNVSGGTPVRMMNAVGRMPSISADGRLLAFTRGGCRISREAYRGPAQRDIWIHNTRKNNYIQITATDGMEIWPDWDKDRNLYYLSAENGRYNLYKQAISASGEKNGDAETLTSFSDDGLRYFDVSHDGSTVTYEKGGKVFIQDLKNGTAAKEFKVQLPADYRFYPVETKRFNRSAAEYEISPNGKYIALTIRGEIFLTQNDKEKSRTVKITDNPARDLDARWLNDTTLIFMSDRDGDYDIYAVRSSDPTEADLFKTFKRNITPITTTEEEEYDPVISPDGKKTCYRVGGGQLVLANIDSTGTISNKRNLLEGWSSPRGVSWSPDSKWIAYSMSDLNFNSEIYIQDTENMSPPVNVSLHPRGDYGPVWSGDGSKLGFLSIRNNGDSDVWFVWLNKEDWEKTQADWNEEDESSAKGGAKKKEGQKGPEPVEIDFEDIHERLVQVTRLPGNESNLMISADGETFYFTTNGRSRQGAQGDPELVSVKWNGKDQKTMMKKARIGSLRWANKGKDLYLLKFGGTIAKIDVKSSKTEGRPFAAKMEINYPAERKQVFDEAWRTLDDGFYDPDFHGQNWSALREKYEPIALSASTSQDFRDVFNDMLGQVNSSHMALRGPDREEVTREQTGMLGIEIKPGKNGAEITAIVPGSPADKSESKLNIGDAILSVNGEPVSENENFYALLTGTSGERILLEVADQDGNNREVIIRPTGSLSTKLYESWVKERKRLTDVYSGGRLGYIHIRGMNWSSFERFERELMASGLGKDGIVIDVRFNGGGWTTDMLMAVLNVRQHSYTIPRGAANDLQAQQKEFREFYPYGERLPLSAWTRPSIALCNSSSYSNAEIFSHAFKALGHGTLVGEATFGAVISTGGRGLIDGSFIRLPFRGWYVKDSDLNMEHGPAVPDIEVLNAPDSKANGEDPQLKTAVDQLLKEINER